jgi:hypothetical protein
MDKSLALSKWSARILRKDLMQHAALDAHASARVAGVAEQLQATAQVLKLEALKLDAAACLLSRASKSIVGYGRAVSAQHKSELLQDERARKYREHKHLKVMVRIVSVLHPGAFLIPSVILVPNQMLGNLRDADQIVNWSHTQMHVVKEEEIEFGASKHPVRAPTNAPVNAANADGGHDASINSTASESVIFRLSW